MPRHDTDAMPRTHEQRVSWSKQVELAVAPTTAWQPDRLAQRVLFDEKTRPHVPDYHSISLVVQNGILYDYYPAKKYLFDGMLGPNVPAEVRARLWDPVMTIPHYANRLRNLCDEAAADYPAMEKLLLREPGPAVYMHTTSPSCHRVRWAILLAVHNLCTLVGLVNSHDTTVVVLQSVLEEQEEALNNNLRHLWTHKYVTPNRKNTTRPGAKDQQSMVRLGRNIGQVFRKFSCNVWESSPGLFSRNNQISRVHSCLVSQSPIVSPTCLLHWIMNVTPLHSSPLGLNVSVQFYG